MRPRPALATVLALACAPSAAALDNGVGRVPPMGWSWCAYHLVPRAVLRAGHRWPLTPLLPRNHSNAKTDDGEVQSTDAAAANATTLPLLFMSVDDVTDRWGRQYPVQSEMHNISHLCEDCNFSHPYLQHIVQGGLLPPNPARPSAGFEIFFWSNARNASELESRIASGAFATEHDQLSVFLSTSEDFKSFSPAVRVAALNQDRSCPSPCDCCPGRCFPNNCIVKSMARSDDGTRYAIMSLCCDLGARPMIADGPISLSGATDAFSPQNATPAYYGHDDINLVYSAGRFADVQIFFENHSTPGVPGSRLKYCDLGGEFGCEHGYRRVVSYRTSDARGLHWSANAACPQMQWGADHELLPCKAGWRADAMILPDADDPPDMQIFKMVAMRVGSTDRWFGFASLGAPAPMVALGPHYGDQHKLECAHFRNATTNKTAPDLRYCNGPGLGAELMIGPSGDVVAEPLSQHWQRPFRTFDLLGLASESGSAPGAGMVWNGHHAWFNSQLVRDFVITKKGKQFARQRPAPSMVGVPMFRLAGLRAHGNAEFSTAAFRMPSAPLWVNANVSWPGQASGCTNFVGCQAYVMVAVHDAGTKAVIPGFEAAKCVIMDADGPMLPLRWAGSMDIANQLVTLRVYFRESVVYAIGFGNDTRLHTDDSSAAVATQTDSDLSSSPQLIEPLALAGAAGNAPK